MVYRGDPVKKCIVNTRLQIRAERDKVLLIGIRGNQNIVQKKLVTDYIKIAIFKCVKPPDERII